MKIIEYCQTCGEPRPDLVEACCGGCGGAEFGGLIQLPSDAGAEMKLVRGPMPHLHFLAPEDDVDFDPTPPRSKFGPATLRVTAIVLLIIGLAVSAALAAAGVFLILTCWLALIGFVLIAVAVALAITTLIVTVTMFVSSYRL